MLFPLIKPFLLLTPILFAWTSTDPAGFVLLSGEGKEPAPSAESVGDAKKEIRSIYETEYGQTDSKKLRDFAKELFDQALKTRDNPVIRYALLEEAMDVAAGVLAMEIAFQAADRLQRHFEKVSACELKSTLLKKVRGSARTSEQKKTYARYALLLAQQALQENAFDLARSTVRSAESFAKMARAADLAARIGDLEDEIPVYEREYRIAEDALQTLSLKALEGDGADDPEASEIYGKYLCFIKADWTEGLRFLEKAADENLRNIARLERTPGIKNNAAGQYELGEGYRTIAEENHRNPVLERNVLTRALGWYRAAAPRLTGFEKLRTKKRIEEIEEKIGKVVPPLKAPASSSSEGGFVLQPGEILAPSKSPKLAGHSIRIEASLKTRTDGVIVTQGAKQNGFTLSIKEGMLQLSTVHNSKRTVIRTSRNLPTTDLIVEALITNDGRASLQVNGRELSRGEVPGPWKNNPKIGLTVGKIVTEVRIRQD